MTTNAIKNVKFLQGGNATFTVANNKGEHFTYKIRKPSEQTPFFASLLTGPNNESDYRFMGIFNPEIGKVFLGKTVKFTNETTSFKVLNWAISMLKNNKELPQGYKIVHEGSCCRCGRTLTTPESIENGIGPECAKKFDI